MNIIVIDFNESSTDSIIEICEEHDLDPAMLIKDHVDYDFDKIYMET